MYIVLESILFVLTEGCSWRAIDRPQARWNSVYDTSIFDAGVNAAPYKKC